MNGMERLFIIENGLFTEVHRWEWIYMNMHYETAWENDIILLSHFEINSRIN